MCAYICVACPSFSQETFTFTCLDNVSAKYSVIVCTKSHTHVYMYTHKSRGRFARLIKGDLNKAQTLEMTYGNNLFDQLDNLLGIREDRTVIEFSRHDDIMMHVILMLSVWIK